MANPHDPALNPVAAAQAFLDAQAAAVVPVAPSRAPPRPVIAPANLDRWSTVIDLAFPLIVDGVVLSSVTLKRLNAKELADMIMDDDGEDSLNRRARAAIAGIHPDVLDALEGDDATRILEAIRPFLPRALLGAEVLLISAAAVDMTGAGSGGA